MSTFYAEDFAHIHDQGFGSFAQAATPFVLKTLASRATRNPLVVELGCGSGITAAALVRKGYSVLGVDISAAMLDLVCKRAPAAEFRQVSAYDTDTSGVCGGAVARRVFGLCSGILIKPRTAFRIVPQASPRLGFWKLCAL